MYRVIVCNRLGTPLFDLPEDDVFELSRKEEVNGEHSLTVTTTRTLEQGWRILTLDERGRWREHVVYGTDALHDAGDRPFGTYYCVWSVQPDLMGTRVSAMPGVQTPCNAAVALDAALGGTSRWQRGTVTNTATGGASMYDTDGWSAIKTMVATWGGEIDVTVQVDEKTGTVTARKVDYYAKQGEQTVKRRFDFGADLKSVRRTVPDGPLYCRITPRGRGEDTGSGYGRKITIASVNGGLDYLENAAMTDIAKLPDGSGGWEYPTLEVENPEIETPSELKTWAQGILEESTVPKVTYEVDVLQLAREGVDLHGVSLGDAVHVVDRKFGDGIRVSARVAAMTVNLLYEDDVQLTLGHIGGGVAGMMAGLGSRLSMVADTVQAMNGGTFSTADYLTNLVARINAEINATGGYAYIVPGHGILTYDTAVADPLNPVEAGQVVEVKGGTIRIANTRTAQGEWEWKTVFVSGHVAAQVVTTAELVAGFIGNAAGTYWDLDNNQLHLPATTIMDDTTLGTVMQRVNATISGVDVEYAQGTSSTTAPTSGWSTTPPAYEAGKYIWSRTATTTPQGTSYSTPVMISGRDGEDGTSVTILGSYNTLADLQTAHPTGSLGDGYIVAGDLYVWDGAQWEDVGTIRGPQGAAGTDGADGSQIWTATSDPTTPNYTFALSALTGPSGVSPKVGDLVVRSYYRYTVTSVSSSSVLAGNRTSIRGATGAAGASITVTDVQWAEGTSGTTAPSSGWQSSIPSVAQGKWLWCRTTYSDGTTTDTCSYMGTDGDDGASVHVQSSTKSGGTTTVVLTDGTTSTTLTIDDGADGTDGVNGTNGANGANGYVHIAWANSADGSQDFSTSVSANKKYIGVYSDNTQADSTSYASYSWSLIKGADGTDGTDGVGISAMVDQYYLSTSNSAQVDGTWRIEQPAWEPGKYIWTRSQITWDDNSVTYTEPVLAGALNSANEAANYAVGGTNLLDDTNAPSLTKVTAAGNRYIESANYGEYTSTIAEISNPPVIGIKYGQHLVKTSGAQSHSVSYYSGSRVMCRPGNTYTMSVYARHATAASDTELVLQYGYQRNGTNVYPNKRFDMPNDAAWHRYTWTFTTPSDMDDIGIIAYPGGISTPTCNVWFCGWKLEAGEKATDWCISTTDAIYPNTMVRAYGSGILVCKQGNTVGALVNSNGSFDVVKVTWSGDTPTASTVYATYGPNSIIGDAAKAHVEISPDYGFGVYGSNPANTGQIVEIGRVGYESRTKPYFTFGTRTSGSTKGTSSVALGWDTAASGDYSLSQGQGTTASGQFAVAFGTQTSATNTASVAFGFGSVSNGAYAVAMGRNTKTTGQACFAGGTNSIAGGQSSLAYGQGVQTANYYETALGAYNVVSTGTYTNKLVVGGGSSDSDRKNILTLSGTGRLTIAGSLVQNSDRRLKTHVAYLGEDARTIIGRLKPAVFVKDGGRHYGFYAQDVQMADIWDTKTVEAQHTDESLDFDPLTLDYTALIAPLVAYAQSLEKCVDALENRLAKIERKVSDGAR